ncbi:unnamed protein product [Macrosiphum euphorbiae]|uniref:Transposable element P transposase n=1 Tax=Macrosiphum euphorbiae TaxID=13131 RepID=A0AAV0WI19_9HEMI|nr:unnamed protein product [Macrosiphum euphorbiae]
MSVLKENVKHLKPSEKFCSILSDEVCLSSGLSYDSVTDPIDGFVDTGYSKSQNIADHALVFMVRGIKKKFKQPIAYSFCKGATTQHELIRQLKQVIRCVHQCGLKVVATISDQGSANCGAIKILNQETRSYYIKNELPYNDEFYEIELENNERLKLVHIYDVPHLIKCIRNNLITKDLVFTINNDVKCAKLSHLVDLYNVDNAIPDCKMLPRLTDQHIIPEKIMKMKVKNATQVFSQRVSSTMNFLASRNIISSDAQHTASLCLFFDNLFDSLNGNFDKVVDGKIYRTSVKKNSPHHQLWADSLKVLNTMRFVGRNGKNVSVPTIRSWMTTIRAFQTLYKVLGSVGIKSLLPRNLNQDSLECFFGAIRNVGSANPNCNAFTSAYKTLVLNNLVSSHSPGSNCEEDFAEGRLAQFKNLFMFSKTPSTPSDKIIAADLPLTIHQLPNPTSYLRDQTHSYIAGFIIKKLN